MADTAVAAVQNSESARQNASKWYRLLTIFPELTTVQTRVQWNLWQRNHIAVPANNWQFKELYDAWLISRHIISAQAKPAQTPLVDPLNTGFSRAFALATGLAGGEVIRRVIKPKIPPPPDLKDYTENAAKHAAAEKWVDGKLPFGKDTAALSEKEVFEKWLKDNKEKNANSKRAQAYKDSEQFKEDRIQDIIQRSPHQITALANEEKRKIYTNPNQDPMYLQLNRDALIYADHIIREAKQYPRMYGQLGITAKDQKTKNQQILQYARGVFLKDFAKNCPEKAFAYAYYDENLQVQRKILRGEIKPEDARRATLEAKLMTQEAPAPQTPATKQPPAVEKVETIAPVPPAAIIMQQQEQLQHAARAIRTQPAEQTAQMTQPPKFSTWILNKANFFSRPISRPPAAIPRPGNRGSTIEKGAEREGAQAAKIAIQAIEKLLFSPGFWPFLLAFVFVLIVIVLIILFLTGGLGIPPVTGNNPTKTPIPGLTINKSGPDHVRNPSDPAGAENITYTINITYSGNSDVLISDAIPDNTDYVSATPSADAGCTGCAAGTRAISWRLNDVTPENTTSNKLATAFVPPSQTPAASGTRSYTLMLVVKPTGDDKLVTNKAVATAPQSGSVGGAGCPTDEQMQQENSAATCKLLDPSVDIRDTNIPQDTINTYIQHYEPTFVGKPLSDANEIGTAAEFEKRVNYIVAQFQKAGVNPVLGLAYWKTESLFSTYPGAKHALGCAPDSTSPTDFYKQVDCASGLAPGGFVVSKCITANNPNDPSCITYKGLMREGGNDPPTTFDDFAWEYGPFSDTRGGFGNCTHSYNIAVGVIKELNACQQKGLSAPKNVSSTGDTLTTESAPVSTRVGNPPITSGDVLKWAQTIVDHLQQGAGGGWSIMVADISNNGYTVVKHTDAVDGAVGPNGNYWCAYLVADAYNLAGIKGLSQDKDGAVVNEIGDWKNLHGYTYLDFTTGNHTDILSQVKPGYAMFMQTNPGAYGTLDHAAIVKSININSHGDGSLVTINSNIENASTELTYTFSAGQQVQAWTSAPIVGFGTAQ